MWCFLQDIAIWRMFIDEEHFRDKGEQLDFYKRGMSWERVEVDVI